RLPLHAPEELEDLLGLAGIVALVVPPAHLAVLDEHGLDGRGAHVDGHELPAGRGRLLPHRRGRGGGRQVPGWPRPGQRDGVARGAGAHQAAAPRRPMRAATWKTVLAATPAAWPSRGIRYVARFISGCASR